MKKIELIIPEGITTRIEAEEFISSFCFKNDFSEKEYLTDQYVELVFPESMKIVNRLHNPWIKNNVKRIVFGKNTVSIGRYAFNGYKKLADVVFPDSLVLIDDYAFSACNLSNVKLGTNLKVIGRNVFSYNFVLKEINFDDCVYLQSIGKDAFSFTSIKKINLSNTICNYSDNLAKYCLNCDNITVIKPYFITN